MAQCIQSGCYLLGFSQGGFKTRCHSKGFADHLRTSHEEITSQVPLSPDELFKVLGWSRPSNCHTYFLIEGFTGLFCCMHKYLTFCTLSLSLGTGSVRKLRRARSVCRACASVSTTCCVALCCVCGSAYRMWCLISPAPVSCRLFALKPSSTTSKLVSTSPRHK